MRAKRTRLIYAASLILSAGLFAGARAQTRTLVPQTTIYNIQGDRVAQGAVPGESGSSYVTYSGQVQTNGKGGLAVRSFSLTVFYTTDGGTATVTGGHWSLTTVKEQISSSVGGSIDAGSAIPFDSKGSMAVKGLILNASGSTSLGPCSGFFNVEIAQGTKVKGAFTLTYLVLV